MSSELLHGYYLNDVLVEPAYGRLTRDGDSLHLTPKASEVLLCLAERAGDVVSREFLLATVWGKGHGSPEALNHAIGEVRRVLGDHHEHPSYIQTLPRRGYRLLIDPQPISGAAGGNSTQWTRNRPIQQLWHQLRERNVVRVALAYAAISWLLLQVAQVMSDALQFPDWLLRLAVVVLAVGFLVAVVVAWLFEIVPDQRDDLGIAAGRLNRIVDFGIIATLAIAVTLLVYTQIVDESLFDSVDDLPKSMTSPKAGKASVAVMRFQNFGGAPHFSNGLGEQLSSLLASLEGIRVPSRTATWLLSDKGVEPKQLARELSVHYVLEGSVQQQNEQIRVTAQLIDGSSGDHVWAETYDGQLSADSFFRLQDLIAKQVVDKLKLTFSDDDEARFSRRQTKSNDALLQYLIGRSELAKPAEAESLSAAVTAFEASITADPSYAEAHAGLCQAQLRWYVSTRNTAYFDAAESACIRALRIDDELGEVYAALGSLHRYAGQVERAVDELIVAREKMPGASYVLEELGRAYRAAGRRELAEQTFREAIRMDPGNWSVYKSMGNFLFRSGRYADALSYYKQVTILQPESPSAFTNIGSAFFMLGDFENATIAWQISLELSPTHVAYMNYANSQFYRGRFKDSVEAYRKAIELNENDYRAWGSLAASCSFVTAETECARNAYEKSIALIDQQLAINPNDPSAVAALAAHFARIKRHEDARRTLDRLDVLDSDDPDVSFFEAVAWVALDEQTKALEALQSAVTRGYPAFLINADPTFNSLHDKPEFSEIVTTRLQ